MSKILSHPFKPLFTRKSDQDVQHKPQLTSNPIGSHTSHAQTLWHRNISIELYWFSFRRFWLIWTKTAETFFKIPYMFCRRQKTTVWVWNNMRAS